MKREIRQIRRLRYVCDEDDPDCYDEDGNPFWFYNFAEVFFDEEEGAIRCEEFPLNRITATGEEKALWILIQELQRAMQEPPITFFQNEGKITEEDPAERKEQISLLTDPD